MGSSPIVGRDLRRKMVFGKMMLHQKNTKRHLSSQRETLSIKTLLKSFVPKGRYAANLASDRRELTIIAAGTACWSCCQLLRACRPLRGRALPRPSGRANRVHAQPPRASSGPGYHVRSTMMPSRLGRRVRSSAVRLGSVRQAYQRGTRRRCWPTSGAHARSPKRPATAPSAPRRVGEGQEWRRHGNFVAWVKVNCEFSHDTAGIPIGVPDVQWQNGTSHVELRVGPESVNIYRCVLPTLR